MAFTSSVSRRFESNLMDIPKKWYHGRRTLESAQRILKGGFRHMPSTYDEWNILSLELINNLSPEEQEIFSPLPEDRKGIEKFARVWKARNGNGTMIWLSEEPVEDYGPYYLEVVLPPEARIIVPADCGIANDGPCFFYPKPVIPARCFKPAVIPDNASIHFEDIRKVF